MMMIMPLMMMKWSCVGVEDESRTVIGRGVEKDG
jgi:hypothetical protein